MKSLLISTKAIWTDKTKSGDKKVEVRKRKPDLIPPFKCYIYETKGTQMERCGGKEIYHIGIGLVVGEFICDDIYTFLPFANNSGVEIAETLFREINYEKVLKETCLTENELLRYIDNEVCYGLHISNLKIYDTPKDLSKFKKAGWLSYDDWLWGLYPNTHCTYDAWAKRFEITKPPQSWCYVEELQ